MGSGPLALSEEAFRAQIEWLATHAKPTSLDGILERPAAAGLQVALAFDDGYESLHRVVAPILREAGLVAIVYLNTRCIADDRHNPSDEVKGHYAGEHFLCWGEVRALRALGWTIGSHGVDHVDFTQQSAQEREAQLRLSKAAIEQRLGVGCRHLAYPWGRHNAGVRAAVQRCGYRWAVAAVHGVVSARSDRYAISRIDIRKDYELQDFIAIVRGDWDFLRYAQLARRAVR